MTTTTSAASVMSKFTRLDKTAQSFVLGYMTRYLQEQAKKEKEEKQ